jgi:glycerate kinase
LPDTRILNADMVDGGEVKVQALVRATGGQIIPARVTRPVGKPVDSFFGLMGGPGPRTAVIEMAAAAGLSLVPRDQRNPILTTSLGVGELILAALDHQVERILVGCDDNGIKDGGAGLAQALGAHLRDENGAEIGHGGGALSWLHEIDRSGLDPRLAQVRIDAAVNWHNMLLGPKSLARVFSPQKGATPSQVQDLDRAMIRWAAAIRGVTGKDVGTATGAGAKGGLGAGLIAFVGATLHPRFDIIQRYLDFDRLLDQADLVITAEGSLDGQSPYGKVPCEVARRAAVRGVPTVALAGTIGKGVDQTFDHGIAAFASILKRPCTLEEAIRDREKLLRHAAEEATRMMAVGLRLSQREGMAA